jgi:hypothetical protein
MTCEKLKKALAEFLDGELEAEICQQIERHMIECPDCEIVVSTTRRTLALYRDRALYVELPLDVRERLTVRLRRTLQDP